MKRSTIAGRPVRRSRVFGAAALLLALAGCQGFLGDDDGEQDGPPEDPPGVANPAGDGSARCGDVAIAYVGTINGDNAAIGGPIRDGVELAVDEHNRANPNCQVEFVEVDTEGVARKAEGIVSGLVDRTEVLGVVGPPFSAEAAAVGERFDDADLVQITPSAAETSLAHEDWATFYRGTANDTGQARAAEQLLTRSLDAGSVCVVDDGTSYGENLADVVAEELGDVAACTAQVSADGDIVDAVDDIDEEAPDAVYYAGYYERAAAFAEELADSDVDTQLVASDASMVAQFVEDAGDAAEGTYFTCPCAPDDQLGGFTARYAQQFGDEPGAYAVEAYDAATVLLSGIDAGHQDRDGLRSYVDTYQGKGLSNPIEFTGKGELAEATVWAYQVSNGSIGQHAKIR